MGVGVLVLVLVLAEDCAQRSAQWAPRDPSSRSREAANAFFEEEMGKEVVSLASGVLISHKLKNRFSQWIRIN